MANVFTNFLDSLSGGLDNTNLKDYQHANRLFVQNFYRLAPKHGFLYFVRFRLNPNVADNEAWRSSRQDLELGMLVKKCDLPKVSLEGTTLNVYNKKQPVYTKVMYMPINMVLHDDNKGLVREFWQMYYQYHVADSYYGGSNASPGIMPVNPKNRYAKPDPVTNEQLTSRSNPRADNYVNTTDPGRYGLDTNVTENMIRSIEIYQLSRKQFFLHTLINPKIRTWNMDTLASDSKNLMEHNISIEYEGVYFGKGKVTRFTPDGWTDLHYDLDPSPIGGIFGRGDGGLLGPNGLIADGTTLFEDLEDLKNNPEIDQRQALAILLQSARVIGNAINLNQDLARQQVNRAVTTGVGFVIAQETVGSVDGLAVSRGGSASQNTTEALPRQNISNIPAVVDGSSDTPDASTTNTVRSN
jgi:hypothetical protein